MSLLKEIAKFASGAEAFHASIHIYCLLSGTTLTVFGIAPTPTWHIAGAIANAVFSLLLGIYAWGPYGQRSG